MLRLRNHICVSGCKEEKAILKALSDLGFELTIYEFGEVRRISYGADDYDYKRVMTKYQFELKELNA